MPASSGGQALREMVPVVRALWQGDYAHDGEIWKFPTSTSVPKPISKPHPPMWIAARAPDSHNFAVANGCNVMVTPGAIPGVIPSRNGVFSVLADPCCARKSPPRYPALRGYRHRSRRPFPRHA